MQPPSRPPNPPPPDISSGKPSGPVLDGRSSAIPDSSKQCYECRQVLPMDSYGYSKQSIDLHHDSCLLCTAQGKRLRYVKKYGPVPHVDGRDDTVLRNNLHHVRAVLGEFFHSTFYSVSGPCFHIPTRRTGTFLLQRIPNTAKVEVSISFDDGQFTEFFGLNRLETNAIELLCSVLRDYRVEPNEARMRMAHYYIYDPR